MYYQQTFDCQIKLTLESKLFGFLEQTVNLSQDKDKNWRLNFTDESIQLYYVTRAVVDRSEFFADFSNISKQMTNLYGEIFHLGTNVVCLTEIPLISEIPLFRHWSVYSRSDDVYHRTTMIPIATCTQIDQSHSGWLLRKEILFIA